MSVLGLYAHDASSTLWVCSSDAGNGALAGNAPAALKAFDLATGAARGQLGVARVRHAHCRTR